MNNVEFLQNWYKSNCNGDWEHSYGIKIETLDNPGWYVIVDLEDTSFANLVINESYKKSDDDWINIAVVSKQLILSGDADKLIILLNKVKEILS